MSTALVTGATVGIGNSFARRLAQDRYDLVIVSRNGEHLEKLAVELRTTYGIEVEVLPADLADDEGCRVVERRLSDPERPVDALVNNAGFTVGQSFLRSDIDEEDQMLRILVRAVLRLTRAALPGMVQRRHGFVINVSSVASFVPQGTYSAAKAWVTSFSQGVAGDLVGTGVRVQALCPGYTRTDFFDRAGIDMSGMPEWMWLEVEDVVDQSFAALARNQVVCVPGKQYKTIVGLARHAPVRVLSAVTRAVRRSRRGPRAVLR